MQAVKIISTSFDNFNRRIIKFLRMGKSDVQTAFDASPFGIDSNPVKDWVAIYSPTSEVGKTVIIGYIKRDQLAAVGETRLYSTDTNGALKFYAWLRNNGTLELGGNAKNLARYQELKTGFDQLKADHNDLVTAFNTHMHATAATGPPSTPTPGSGIPAIPSQADIADCKIDEIKTL